MEWKEKYKYEIAHDLRHGKIGKTYKLKQEIVEAFAEACRRNGEGQATALHRMMLEYIRNTEEKKKETD